MKTVTKKYDDIIADIAEAIHKELMTNMFSFDYCVRYNRKDGAYFSKDDYNDDEIVLRPDRHFAALTYPQLKAHLIGKMKSLPVFPID